MPLTNLLIPGGLTGPGVATYPALPSPTGAVLYVLAGGIDSRSRLGGLGNSVTGSYGDPAKPLASVFGTNGAVSYCTAGRGDLIIVLPGHTEAIGAASTIPAGVTILGLGYGASRPTFSLNTATTATITLNAGARLQNCIVNGFGFAAIAAVITLAGAGAQVIGCRIVMADATNKATLGIKVSASDCLISNSDIDATAAAGSTIGIGFGAATARLVVQSSTIRGDFGSACMSSAGSNHATEMLILNNNFVQRNGTAKSIFNFTTSSTGLIANNICNGTTWTTAADVAANSSNVALRWFQNYGFDDGAGVVSGVLVPAAGTIA